MNFVSKHKTVFSVLAAIVVLALIGASFPFFNGDGLSKFSGAKHEAAQISLGDYSSFDSGPGTIPGISKLYVDKVVYTPGQTKECQGEDNYNAYVVQLRTMWWFGYTTASQERNMCSLFGLK